MIGSSVQSEIHELRLGTSASPGEDCGGCFVLGAENQLLAALFESLFHSEEAILAHCNPLTLVGPSGSGKSMLVQGLARRWQDSIGSSNALDHVAYFTAADFGRELQAFTDGDSSDIIKLRTWRRKLRQAELLIVEDLDQLRQRSTIQQELCRSIDAIVDQGGRAILTASREPLMLANLRGDGDALVDRLTAGLVLRLQSPGPLARRHLLRNLAESRDLDLSEEQLASFVKRSNGKPVARLAGLLTELDYNQQTGNATSRIESDEAALSFPQIATVVCRYLGIKKTDLKSSSRRKSLTQARGIAIVLARQLTDLSYTEIGRHLGGRDHSTIMSAAEKIARDRNKIPALEQALGELEHLLTAV